MSQKLERLTVSKHNNDQSDDSFATTTNSISTNKLKSNIIVPMLKYERFSRRHLQELRLKRDLLENCQTQLDKTLRRQSELRQQLDNECRISKQINIEYTRTRDKVVKLEIDLVNAREDAAKSKVYLEVMEKENKTLKEQNLLLQTENNMKDRTIDELEKRLKYSSIEYDNETLSDENYNEISTSIRNIAEEKKQIETLQNDLQAERNINSALTAIMNNMIQQLTKFQQQENESKHEIQTLKNKLLCDNHVTSIIINKQKVDVSIQTVENFNEIESLTPITNTINDVKNNNDNLINTNVTEDEKISETTSPKYILSYHDD